ncbi:MAG TPA: family 43 glycosylhydrolase [Candidatus Eisenbergiella merdavium]|uniref:Family 43 glycosylhydrolase n=1 Tax=Candidatus Eisenbergiella merdavium TaxID=2838551 RepID=A0A9D2NDX5_9FIRM|nr:family 43 glycosylhydrolase [Candidatus Eisenbergiella merdavium]
MNPILPNQYYIPDVEARVDTDGTVYLYGSKDIVNDDCYCSREYQVFASRDLKEWKTGEISFSAEWMKKDTELRLYAPDCIKKEEKYYLLYCLADGTEGIAESAYPMGPFQDRGVIPGICGIDPSALVENGKVYYFWGQISLKGAQLDLESCRLEEGSIVEGILTQDKDGFHEGSSIRKIGDKYYLIYTDTSRGRATCLGYAVSDSPLGPYEKKGIIIDNTGCDPSSWNNHGSIQKIGEQYYVFYHRSTHNSEFSRHVCIEPIFIHEDGTIDEVEMTSQGAEAYIECTRRLEASAFCLIHGKAFLQDFSSAGESFEFLTNIHDHDGAFIKYYLFDKEVKEFCVLAANVGEDAVILVHLDNAEGEVAAAVTVGRTEGHYDFQKFSGAVSRQVEGKHAVYLEFIGKDGKLLNLKSMYFK